MAKKDKKTEGAVQNREIFQRMNFLYQAAICMAAITTPSSKTSGQDQTTTTEAIDDTKAGSVVHLPEETAKELVQSSLSKSNPARLSRARTRAQFRQNKNRIAKDQISTNTAHQGLTKRNRHHDTHSLSGISRFYAATLREVGRKNVIRIGPVIKRTICIRCDAVLIPSVSSEVRLEAEPQLNTLVTCTACGAFRRYYCMPGRDIEGDWQEPGTEETKENINNNDGSDVVATGLAEDVSDGPTEVRIDGV